MRFLHLIRNEILYHWIFIAAACVASALIALFQLAEDSFRSSMVGFFVFLLINPIHMNRLQEKRSRLIATLPIKAAQAGMVRIGLYAICYLGAICTFLLLSVLRTGSMPADTSTMLTLFGFLICTYSTVFILSDLVPDLCSRYRTGWVLLLVLSVVVGILTLVAVKTTGAPPAPLSKALDLLVDLNPFSGSYGLAKFGVFTLLLVSASLITMSRRKASV